MAEKALGVNCFSSESVCVVICLTAHPKKSVRRCPKKVSPRHSLGDFHVINFLDELEQGVDLLS